MSTGDIDITDLTDLRTIAARIRSCAVLIGPGTVVRVPPQHLRDELNELAAALDVLAQPREPKHFGLAQLTCEDLITKLRGGIPPVSPLRLW